MSEPHEHCACAADWAIRAQAECARLAGERDALRQQITVMMSPCRCDPLYSGEQYCNGGCELREERDAARAALAESERQRAFWEACAKGQHDLCWVDGGYCCTCGAKGTK